MCRSEDRREIEIMSMLDGEWAKAVGAEFKKPYYRDLYNFVRDEYATHVVYPPDRKSTRLNSSHRSQSRMPSSA